jgi:hypothetical protein
MTATSTRPGEYLLPERARHAYCRSCGATIVWTKTKDRHAIPLDLATAQERDGARWALTHFATCPDARGWRRNGAEVIGDRPIADNRKSRDETIGYRSIDYRLSDGTLLVAWWLFRRRNITTETSKWSAPDRAEVERELAAMAEQHTEDL